MANIVTVQLRCMRALGYRRRVKAQRIAHIICPSGSYFVPLWSTDNLVAGVVDFQYGTRWSPAYGLSEGWTYLKEIFTSIWVRYYDQGHDREHYIALGATCSVYEGAMYGFDGLTITLKDDDTEFWPSPFVQIAPKRWQVAQLKGKYHERNPRVVWDDDLCLPSPSTPTALTYLSTLPDDIPQPIHALLQNDPDRLDKLDLTWQGRLVKRIITINGELKQYPIDHWDNFVHPEYERSLTVHQDQWRLS